MNFVTRMLSGYAVKIGSRYAVQSVKWFMKKYEKQISSVEDRLINFDNWLEAKTGIDLFPDEKQAQWDKAIELAFDEVEHTLTDGAKWRMLMRAVQSGTFDEVVAEKIKKLEGTAWAKATMGLPAEAKEWVGKLKERLGRAKFRDIWNVFKPGEDVEEKHVKAAFKKLAEVHKENKNTFELLIEESARRKAELKS